MIKTVYGHLLLLSITLLVVFIIFIIIIIIIIYRFLFIGRRFYKTACRLWLVTACIQRNSKKVASDSM